MKLASLHDGSRDGQLVVVSRDLRTAHYATGIATRMQQLLDDWNFVSPQLEDLYATLNDGKPRHAFAFDPRQALAPLPRAFQFAVACVAGIEQRSGDALLGAHAAWPECAGALALSPGLAAITGDLPVGASLEQALDSLRLLMLFADAQPLGAGDDSAATPPASGLAVAFSPVAVTLDELGAAWRGGRMHRPLSFGPAGGKTKALDLAPLMTVPPATAAALLARLRPLRAGTIVGSRLDGVALPLAAGERIQAELLGADGGSVFGALAAAAG